MSNYVGDFTLGATVDMKFTTVGQDGSPQPLTGGTICLFADNSTTSITAGVTFTLNFGGLNGLNHVRVAATAGNGYSAGSSYHIVVTGGSISAIDLKGYAVGTFSLQQRYTNVAAWAGASVTASFLLPVTVRVWDQTSVSSSNVAVADFSTRLNANVQQWRGASVSASNVAVWSSISSANVSKWAGQSVTVSFLLPVTVRVWDQTSVSSSNVAVADFSTRLNVNVQQWAGKSTSSSDLAAFSVSQTVLTSATIAGSVNVGQWGGITVSASNLAIQNFATARVLADVRRWNGVSTSSSDIAIKNTLAKTTHITGFNDISKQSVSAIMFSTQMTEGYAITTSQMTLPQAVYGLWAFLTQFGITGTTYTTKKLDKATTAMTFSLDSAVTPSAITRET